MSIHYREEVDEIFKEHDKDLDGKLSWEELCGEETKNEKAFKLMDVDKNGKVSKEVKMEVTEHKEGLQFLGVPKFLQSTVNETGYCCFQEI